MDTIYQVVIASGLVVFMVNLVLNILSFKKPSREALVPNPPPLVSIMVPARDEETNIGRCLKSLQRQDYPNLEIIVLDDNSTDRTSEIVRDFVSADPRIRLIEGAPLPDGWAGKPHACHQMSSLAAGDWFLFVDADTVHAPHMLRSTLSLAIEEHADLLSGFPRQLAGSFCTRIGIPLIYFIIMSWFPLWALQLSRKPRPSLAIGQYLLFTRRIYNTIGGHTAVRSRILEDVWLGVETVKAGGRHVAVDLTGIVSCRMYRGIAGLWEGFTRWLYSVSTLSVAGLVALVLAAWFFYLSPYYWLWHEFTRPGSPSPWLDIIVFQVGIIFLIRLIANLRFHESPLAAIFHPLAIAFLIFNAVVTLLRRALGAGVAWKKRSYGGESSIE